MFSSLCRRLVRQKRSTTLILLTCAVLAGSLSAVQLAAADAVVPLAPVDVNYLNAAEISLKIPPAAPWVVKPDTSPATAATPVAASIPILPSPVPAEVMQQFGVHRTATGTDSVPLPEDDSTAVIFTSAAANLVAIQHSAIDRSGHSGTGAVTLAAGVECYDLSTGAVKSRVEIPVDLNLQDASPTGKTLLFSSGKANDCINVITLGGKQYFPSVSFYPYGVGHGIETAAMVDETHALSLSFDGVLVLWQLPDAKPIWRAQTAQRANDSGSHIALSPQRKIAAVQVIGNSGPDGVMLFEPLSGKCLNLATIDGGIRTGSVAFSPSGRTLAVIGYGSADTRLHLFDLSTGKRSAVISLPASPTDVFEDQITDAACLQFCGLHDDYVLAGRYLASTEIAAVIWKYGAKDSGYRIRVNHGNLHPVDGAYFLIFPDHTIKPALLHMTLPDDKAKRSLAAVKPDDLYDWHPGMSVSLKVSAVGSDDYQKQALADWTRAMQTQGIKIVDNSPNVLTATTSLKENPVKYDSGDGNSLTVNYKTVAWSIHLSVNGKDIWVNDSQYSSSPQLMIHLDLQPGENAQQAADRQFAPPDHANQVFPPPRFIYKQGHEIPLTIVGAAAQPNVNPVQQPRPAVPTPRRRQTR